MANGEYDNSEFYRFEGEPGPDDAAYLRARDDQIAAEACDFIRQNPTRWWLAGFESADEDGFNGFTLLSTLEGSSQAVFEFYLKVILEAISSTARGLDRPAGVVAVTMFQHVLAEVALKHIPDGDEG